MKILEFDHRKYNDDRKIIIYGTIDMAYITTYCLNKLGISVYCYANKKGNYVAPYSNVISLEELAKMYREDSIIVLFTVHGTACTEAGNLSEAGIDKVYSVRKLWNEIDFNQSENKSSYYRDAYNDREQIFFFEDMIRHPGRVYIRTLDAVVTERCSLKCKECSNLMQYYKKPVNLDIEELQNTIDSILNKIDQLCELRILGGEPFMNAEFVKLIDRYKDVSKILKIVVLSNASIFPSEETLEHLKQPKVLMRMSDYGKLSRQLHTWTDWCEANGVRYRVTKMDLWQECGRLERHDYNSYELKDIYGNCDCRNLPTVFGNKLYSCPYAANAANLGAMYRDEAEKDSLIIDENTTGADIDSFLYDREYLEGCRYCNGRNVKRTRTLPYVQISAPLPYEQLIDRQSAVEIKHNVIELDEDRLLSVVIPVYNMEKYIERCLLSVLNQTYENLEIIVVDDGSTDSSAAICSKILQGRGTGRIRFIQNDHAGVVMARNTGIKCAAGEFITFVDADDYLDTDYLEKMMALIGDCDIICSDYTRIWNDKVIPDAVMDRGQGRMEIVPAGIRAGVYEGLGYMKTLWRYMFNQLLPIHGHLWGNVYKTSIMQQVCDGLDCRIFSGEDTVLFFLYMVNCNKAKFVDEYGYYYDCRDSELRYPWEKAAYNNAVIYDSCRKAFQEHPQKDLLLEGLGEYYLHKTKQALTKNKISLKSGGNRFYYPYFGRLRGKRVILYGAGNVGKCYYRHITNDAECVFVAWVDKNADKLRNTELLPVMGVTECLRKYDYDIVIIAVYDENTYESVREELISQGIPEDKIVWNATRPSWD